MRLICEALGPVADDQPAARKPGVLRMEEFMFIKRSPTPSLIAER